MIKVVTADYEIQEALELIWQVFSQFEAPEYSPEGIEEFKAYIDLAGTKRRIEIQELKLWGYQQKNKLVGVIGIRPPAHISLLFVDPAYHRQGIARSLYQAASAAMGEPTITVNSSPFAVPVYRRLGFKETTEEQTVNGIRFIPMKKQGLE